MTGQARELERRGRPVGVVQRDDDGSRSQPGDRHGAEPSGDVGLDERGDLMVDRELVEVDEVEAVMLGERACEVVLAEVAVVDEDLREAAACERRLQRGLHLPGATSPRAMMTSDRKR